MAASGIGRRAPVDEIEFVIEQYRTRYWDFTVKHFHEASLTPGAVVWLPS